MPELPEVEVLVRHLRPLIRGKTIRGVNVRRTKVLAPTSPAQFRQTLLGARFTGLSRRGKYLLFQLRARNKVESVTLLGHLGLTGRIYLARKNERLPRHVAVVLDLGGENLIYEDTRYFGRLTLDTSAVKKLGPEPLDDGFDKSAFAQSLKRSRQDVKIAGSNARRRHRQHLRE
jgi:formamidopyrimidine-DNA glycosylase